MAGCFLICRVFFFDQTLYFFGIGEKNRPTEKLVQLEGVVERPEHTGSESRKIKRVVNWTKLVTARS